MNLTRFVFNSISVLCFFLFIQLIIWCVNDFWVQILSTLNSNRKKMHGNAQIYWRRWSSSKTGIKNYQFFLDLFFFVHRSHFVMKWFFEKDFYCYRKKNIIFIFRQPFQIANGKWLDAVNAFHIYSSSDNKVKKKQRRNVEKRFHDMSRCTLMIGVCLFEVVNLCTVHTKKIKKKRKKIWINFTNRINVNKCCVIHFYRDDCLVAAN